MGSCLETYYPCNPVSDCDHPQSAHNLIVGGWCHPVGVTVIPKTFSKDTLIRCLKNISLNTHTHTRMRMNVECHTLELQINREMGSKADSVND